MDIIEKKETGLVKNEDIFLKKHVGLIHCENRLTLIQRKICNILLFNALDKLNEQEIFEISLRQLCSLVGYNSHDSRLIKDAIKNLISVVMEWNLLEDQIFLGDEHLSDENAVWNASSLLAGASIKKGMIRYSYSPQMKSILSSLEIYGRINLFVQAKFNSTYSLVLYENCIRFKSIHKTAWFSLELFRSLMGVSKDKYQSFKEFKRNVINIAVNEINQKADIFIEPQFKKMGRNISAVQFLIFDNEKYQPTFKKREHVIGPSQYLTPLSRIKNLLISEFKCSEKKADEILLLYPPNYILEKTNFLRTKKNIKNRGAYLLSALKNDFKQQAKKPIGGVIKNSYQREAKHAHEIQSLKRKYMLYKIKKYRDYIEKQAHEVQKKIISTFEKKIHAKIEVYRLYKKSGLSSPFVISDFIEFIDKYFSHIIGHFYSFDDYLTSDEY